MGKPIQRTEQVEVDARSEEGEDSAVSALRRDAEIDRSSINTMRETESSAANSRCEETLPMIAVGDFKSDTAPGINEFQGKDRMSLEVLTELNVLKALTTSSEEVSLACLNASEAQREKFALGRKNHFNVSETYGHREKEAVAYYRKLHKALDNLGSPTEVVLWEDQLIHGRNTFVGDMAESILAGKNLDNLLAEVENMREADWHLFNDPKHPEVFREYVGHCLAELMPDHVQDRVNQILVAKANCDSFAESRLAHRRLQDVIKDLKQSKFDRPGTTRGSQSMLENLWLMNKRDASVLHTNTSFRADVEKFINDDPSFNAAQRSFALRLVAKAAETGRPPEHDHTDQLLYMRAMAAPIEKRNGHKK